MYSCFHASLERINIHGTKVKVSLLISMYEQKLLWMEERILD